MEIRTDLALEKCENLDKTHLPGVNINSCTAENVRITRIEISDKSADESPESRSASKSRRK